MGACVPAGDKSAPRPFGPAEVEAFAATSIFLPDRYKSGLILDMVKGNYHFAITGPIVANGKGLWSEKKVVPGSLQWSESAGETQDLFREDTNRWRWKPKPGRGMWYAETLVCDKGTDLGDAFVGAFDTVTGFFADALRGACNLLGQHPTDAAIAATIAGGPAGGQAVATANGICSALFPPPPPGVPAPAHVLPAGSITARDMKTGLYRVAVPIGLGAALVTHLEIASSPTVPNGARVTTIADFEARTGTGSIWKKPSTYVAGGAVLLGASALGYALMRRRHRT